MGVKACQYAPKRNFDDPLTAWAHQVRGIDRITQQIADEARRGEHDVERAVKIVDRVFAGVVCFVVGLAVMYVMIRAM